MDFEQVKKSVSNYYSEKLNEYGPIPQGVDWNGTDSQVLRFIQLLKILPSDKQGHTLLDYGCGYGALYDYLEKIGQNADYYGYDISESMISKAKKLHENIRARFMTELSKNVSYDYVVSSGIFNVKLENTPEMWTSYILNIITDMYNRCQYGVAFNMLSIYSDPEKRKGNLYYADPNFIFDYCKKYVSEYVSVIHDYPLYEFTIFVRKQIESNE